MFYDIAEQFTSMPGIMDPAVGCNESGNCPLIGTNRDRNFQEIFSELANPSGIIVVAISTGEAR